MIVTGGLKVDQNADIIVYEWAMYHTSRFQIFRHIFDSLPWVYKTCTYVLRTYLASHFLRDYGCLIPYQNQFRTWFDCRTSRDGEQETKPWEFDDPRRWSFAAKRPSTPTLSKLHQFLSKLVRNFVGHSKREAAFGAASIHRLISAWCQAGQTRLRVPGKLQENHRELPAECRKRLPTKTQEPFHVNPEQFKQRYVLC